ncbi:DUF3048 domain-containing protein [Lachnospiraceae bacterium MD1]|uniref:DUF3048 domain-containing protein n=1 Tax=Variimorphobacter saccharofermentans TaxID=2755051 RepID=A0A839K0X2_9FIRM|nr:DUF3048 domain-containing protein [Variimorphobacter saccharofermentans]MBB2183078.1 DUF3048 domain-containing protein [Variimorphobacter saccharofermentans]
MKKMISSILILFIIIAMIGCKKKESYDGGDVIQDYEQNITPTVTPTPEPTVSPTETIEDSNHEGEMRSFLTGLWVPEEIGRKRPYAFQFSNFKSVSNQWGISQADIVYECIVEGGITRLLGIGENYTGDRLGSTRSSRHYFVSIADEYDAIYIHYGKTKYAVSKIKQLGIDNLDGETGIGTTVFYRDKSMKAPHNAFASIDGILAGIKKKGYKTEYASDYKPHYSFYETDTDLADGSSVQKVTLKFSAYTSPYFEYNQDDKLYYRYQFGGPHKDSNNGNQLTFKNIIVQFVKEWDIDRNDYQTMDIEDASGKGYYITNGKMIPITWKKKEASRWMRYYNEAGEELTINPGKTFITLFPNDRTEDVVLN